jgi:signal transduction histidine kinase
MVQQTIQEVRSLAMDIRPSSLDDLGVLPTLDWHFREFQSVYPTLELQPEIRLTETDVPKPLKVVLYRAVQQMLQDCARESAATRVGLRLNRAANRITLDVEDDAALAALDAEGLAARDLYLMTLRERIGLSGGSVEFIAPNAWGGTTVHMEWPT